MDDREFVEELAEEFLQRRRRGDPVQWQDYAAEYPRYAAEIEEVFPALVMVEALSPGQSDVRSQIDWTTSHSGQIGDYRLIRKAGRGGMGIVYEAEQISLGRRVALKILPAFSAEDESVRHRFHVEARAAAQLHHTNIVPVYEVGEHDEAAYYAMQFIQGHSLEQVKRELLKLRQENTDDAEVTSMMGTQQVALSMCSGRWETAASTPNIENESGAASDDSKPQERDGWHTTPDSSTAEASSSVVALDNLSSGYSGRLKYYRSVARIGVQVADALAHAHGEGVVHRDVKPSNLLLDVTGKVWVTDFGLAKIDGGNLTRSGDIVGTVRYMAPERFRGWSDPRSDVYGLGITLYEMLVLRPAFHGKDRGSLVHQILNEEPPSLRRTDRQIPADLETIIARAIDKEPGRRYQKADEFADDLQRFLDHRPIKARRAGPVMRVWRWCQRSPGLAATSTAVILLLLVVAVGGSMTAIQQGRSLEEKQRLLDNLQREAYASNIQQAYSAVEEGNFSYAVELLSKPIRAQTEGADLRGFEWYHLWNRCRPFIHSEKISTLAEGSWAPQVVVDAKTTTFAYAIGTKKLVLRDAETLGSLREIPLLRHSWAVAMSPSGQRLAISTRAGVDIYDTRSGKQVRTIRPANQTGPMAVTFLGESRIAFVEHDRGQFVNVHNLETNADPISLDTASRLPTDSPTAIAAASDAKWLACGCFDRTVLLWDATDLSEPPRTLEAHDTDVLALAFSSHGDLLASAGRNGMVFVWDTQRGTLEEKLPSSGEVRAVAFSSDSQTLAVARGDGMVHLWRRQDGATQLGALPTGMEWIRGVAFLQRNVVAVAGLRTLQLWDVNNNRRITEYSDEDPTTDWTPGGGAVTGVSVSPSGDQIYVAGGLLLDIYDWKARRRLARNRFMGWSRSLHLSPDGNTLAFASGFEEALIMDTRNWRTTYLRLDGPVYKVGILPDGKHLYTHVEDNKKIKAAQFWNLQTLTEEPQMPPDMADGQYLAFSPDNRLVATFDSALLESQSEGMLRVWDRKTHAEIWSKSLSVYFDLDLPGVRFSPSGKILLVISKGLLSLRDSVSFQELHSGIPFAGRLWDVAFSPDDSLLAVADGTGKDKGRVSIWSTQSGALVRTLRPHDSELVMAIAFSRDGQSLITGGLDSTVRIWKNLQDGDRSRDWMPRETDDDEILADADFLDDGMRYDVLSKGENLALVQPESGDGTIPPAEIWNLQTGHRLKLDAAKLPNGYGQEAFSPDETHLTIARTAGVQFWDTATGCLLFESGDYATRIAYSQDSKLVAVFFNGEVAVYETASRPTTPCQIFRTTDGGYALTFSRDGKRLAAAPYSGTANVWDLESDSLLSLSGQSNMARTMQFSPDGKRLLTIASGQASLWDMTNGMRVASFSADYQGKPVVWEDGEFSYEDDVVTLTLYPQGMDQRLVLRAATDAEVADDLRLLEFPTAGP